MRASATFAQRYSVYRIRNGAHSRPIERRNVFLTPRSTGNFREGLDCEEATMADIMIRDINKKPSGGNRTSSFCRRRRRLPF